MFLCDIDVFLFLALSLSLHLSLKSINTSLGEDLKKSTCSEEGRMMAMSECVPTTVAISDSRVKESLPQEGPLTPE